VKVLRSRVISVVGALGDLKSINWEVTVYIAEMFPPAGTENADDEASTAPRNHLIHFSIMARMGSAMDH
jgi:hypothetical protein